MSDAGYLSDGDAAFHKTRTAPDHAQNTEDGYMSEGGASFYARKIQSRIALEKQRTAEEQRAKFSSGSGRPLPGLPDTLGGNKMNGRPPQQQQQQ